MKANYGSVGEENLISRIAILYYSKCPVCNKKLQYMQRNKSMVPYIRKKELIETVPKEALLPDKNFTSVILSMFEELEETMSKELKERMRIMSHQIENIKKSWKFKKKNQTEILELKNTVTEIKKSIRGAQ